MEMFKVSKDMSVPIVSEIFRKREVRYNLRNPSQFCRSAVHSVFHGKESISYLGPKIWDLVPTELKELTTVAAFKREIKKWKPENCPCRLCKQYIQNIGFIGF